MPVLKAGKGIPGRHLLELDLTTTEIVDQGDYLLLDL
jgi:hypothetical protein